MSDLKIDQSIMNRSATIISAWFRMKRERVKYIKLKKQARLRSFNIRELMSTQKSYINDLIFLRSIQQKLLQNKLLTSEESKQIFSNLQEIIQLNYEFFKTIANKIKFDDQYRQKLKQKGETVQMSRSIKFNSHLKESQTQSTLVHQHKILFPNIKIFDVIRQYKQQFFIYSTYYNTYAIAVQFATDMLKKVQIFNFISTAIQSRIKNKHFDFFSYLIKPCQRLAKYQLLFKQIIKNTWAQHPDRSNIQSALELIVAVNKHSDSVMQKLTQSNKVMQICQSVRMSEQDVERMRQQSGKYIGQTNVNIFSYQQQTKARVYVFKDIIIVTRLQEEEELYKIISSRQLTWRVQPKGRYYQHMISLLCQQLTTLTLNLSDLDQFVKMLEQSNATTSQISKRDVEVEVMGTQERNMKTILKFTVYIIQIRINSIANRIFMRFSQLLKFQERLQKSLGYNSPHYSLKKQFGNKYSSRLIEKRKIIIKLFLQELFNSVTFKNCSKAVGEWLSLKQLSTSLMDRSSSPRFRGHSPLRKNMHRSMISSILMKQTDQKLGHLHKQSILTGSLYPKQIQKQDKLTINVYYCLIEGGDYTSLQVQPGTLAEDVVFSILNAMDIQNHRDYRLKSLVDNDSRIVDPSQQCKFFIDSKLFLVKHIWFNQQQQLKDLEECRTKLQLVVKQVFWQIGHRQILLDKSSYVMVLGLCSIIYPDKIVAQTLNELIPEDTRLLYTQAQWMSDVKAFQQSFSKSVSQYDCPKKKLKTMISVLNILIKNNLFGSSLCFVVWSNDAALKKITQQQRGFLAVRYKNVILLCERQRRVLLQIEYKDLRDSKSYPGLILIYTNKFTISLKTHKSYFLFESIRYYKVLRGVVQNSKYQLSFKYA